MKNLLSLMELHNLDMFYVCSLVNDEDIEAALALLEGDYEDVVLEEELIRLIRKDLKDKKRKGVRYAKNDRA